ncbi:tRNA (adenosine(37)-N6)-threonylcarbamoyltransferase complex transferase subunit TsaD [Candidatus Daviesbacteria bacterium]|nr:tRNA (adenosine(37)-N6)-threonylcarbamoyltransferase complex transferase subunit TsaD [Candidatus Daviesbacteria bacterium]
MIETALNGSRITNHELDAIAVTYGPGLIGSLLVGVETAKTLAYVWNKPLIPVNHLIGHFYANWITSAHLRGETKVSPRSHLGGVPKFPCLGLLVSGGHTDLVLFHDHSKYTYLGGTRDDAAGECFDKCARLLGLPYPGGPAISKLAKKGDPNKFKLPTPMKGIKGFDFSYSGLKTAVANLLHTSEVKARLQQDHTSEVKQDLAASIEETIANSLIDKVILAAKKYKVEQIMVAGGVAANQKLVDRLQDTVNSMNPKISLHVPPAHLCTDNAAMIAAAAFFQKPINPPAGGPLSLQADPNLTL